MLVKTAYFIYEMCQLNIKIAFLERKPFGGCLQHPDDFAYHNQKKRFTGYSIHVWIEANIRFLELSFGYNHNDI